MNMNIPYANGNMADLRSSVKNDIDALPDHYLAEAMDFIAYLLQKANSVRTKDNAQVEAFTNEDDALDFANRLSMRTAHEAW
jgi:hypothetical protein